MNTYKWTAETDQDGFTEHYTDDSYHALIIVESPEGVCEVFYLAGDYENPYEVVIGEAPTIDRAKRIAIEYTESIDEMEAGL